MEDDARSIHGFTLIETLITTVILVSGLVAVAQVFLYTAGANINNQQRTAATTLLVEKLEQFKSATLTDSAWTAGGNLNPSAPVAGFFDYVTIGTDGALTSDSTSVEAPYFRVWQIDGNSSRSVTVIVYAQRAGLTRRRMELVRAAAIMSSTF